jgi:hypothetical protein
MCAVRLQRGVMFKTVTTAADRNSSFLGVIYLSDLKGYISNLQIQRAPLN